MAAVTDVQVAIQAAQAGAKDVAGSYGSTHLRYAKSSTDFATEVDIASERAIVNVLAMHRPSDARTGEETGDSGTRCNSRRWLIDPLCGTVNFAAHTPLLAATSLS